MLKLSLLIDIFQEENRALMTIPGGTSEDIRKYHPSIIIKFFEKR